MSERVIKGDQSGNASPERIKAVGDIIRGLMQMVDDNKLVEVESAQPENLKQYEVKDSAGNEITYIRDSAGHLAASIEIRDSNGKLIAQSEDGKDWTIDRYTGQGVDFTVV